MQAWIPNLLSSVFVSRRRHASVLDAPVLAPSELSFSQLFDCRKRCLLAAARFTRTKTDVNLQVLIHCV